MHYFNFHSLGRAGLLLLQLSWVFPADAQVVTMVEGNPGYDQYIPWNSPALLDTITIDVPDDLSLPLLKREFHRTNRFAVNVPIDIPLSLSTTYTYSNFSLSKLAIRVPEAVSLSMRFNNLLMPDGAQLYVYNHDRSYIHGPITNQNVNQSDYNTETLPGKILVFEILSHADKPINLSDISFDRVSVGVTENNLASLHQKGYGDAAPCNQDAICNHLDGWDEAASGVCAIIMNGTEECTGTIINNECNDLNPYLLTAEHCLTGTEGSWQFRFNYNNRLCNNNSLGPTVSSYITYTGADLVVAQPEIGGTDMALLELRNSLSAQTQIRFVGWDRRPDVPNNATFIHHPSGDAKKISFERDPTNVASNDVNYFRFNMTPGQNGDIGTLEGGSSGGPQFNADRRIVATISGGTPRFLQCNTATSTNNNGRFSTAWTGGGTVANRFSIWLSNTGNTTTTNTITPPTIAGSNEICSTSSSQYSITSRDNRTVTWAVTPTNFVSSPSQGTAATFNITPTATASGQLTITATLNTTGANCTPFTITKRIWVGKPSRPTITAPACLIKKSNVTLSAQASGYNSLAWSFPSCSTPQSGSNINPECWYNYSGNLPSIVAYTGNKTGSISVFASNSCGTSSINKTIVYCAGGGGTGPIQQITTSPPDTAIAQIRGSLIVSPNPASDLVYITVPDNLFTEYLDYRVYDAAGRLMESGKVNSEEALRLQLQVVGWARGMYYISVQGENGYETSKFILQ